MYKFERHCSFSQRFLCVSIFGVVPVGYKKPFGCSLKGYGSRFFQLWRIAGDRIDYTEGYVMSTNEPSTNEPPIDLFLAASTNQALATESKANQNQTNGDGSDSDDSMSIDEPDETTDQSLKVIPSISVY